MRRARRPVSALVLLAAVIVAAMASLVSSASARDTKPGRQIVIGAALDLSAGWTSLGRASRVTLQLAVFDANAALAQTGSSDRVKLRIVDTGGDTAQTARAVRRLASQGVRIIIGPQSSSSVGAVRGLAGRLDVVLVSQGSTAHSLAIPGDNVFRLVPDDIREGQALVALLRGQGIDAIVPVWRRDAGNAGLASSVRRQFLGIGGKVAVGVPYATKAPRFGEVASSVDRQVNRLRARGGKRIAVYLAGFDEVVDLFDVARSRPALAALRWYGSDGVALTPRLVSDRDAAAFAKRVGYPNPTVGLPDQVLRQARPLIRRTRARLGRDPDALALTAYDALRIAVKTRRKAPEAGELRRAFFTTADGYSGVTGTIVLNRAGDRAYGSYDFWSVCRRGTRFGWERTFAYMARGTASGRISAYRAC